MTFLLGRSLCPGEIAHGLPWPELQDNIETGGRGTSRCTGRLPGGEEAACPKPASGVHRQESALQSRRIDSPSSGVTVDSTLPLLAAGAVALAGKGRTHQS